MTTTHDVPMPEPCAWVEIGQYCLGRPSEWLLTSKQQEPEDQPIYTADQVRDTAIKYADARCAKLQEEISLRDSQIDDAYWLAGEWRKTCEKAEAERDALAEKVKAMEDDARRLDWIDQMVNKHSAVWLLTSGENQFVQIRSPVFDFGVKNHPTVSGGVRAAIDAATGDEA